MAIPSSPSPLHAVFAAKTYNAEWFGSPTDSIETRISAGIAACAADGALYLFIPASMRGFDQSLVTLNPAVALTQESTLLVGTGSPEGTFPAPVGWMFQQLDGVAGGVLWVKISGTGTTGWQLLSSQISSTIIGGNSKSISRWTDMRMIVEGLNDNDVLTAPFAGESYFGTVPVNPPNVMMRATTGSTQAKYRQGFNPPAGRVIQLQPTTTLQCSLVFRTFATSTSIRSIDVNAVTPSIAGTLSPNLLASGVGPGYGHSTSIMAWIRKSAGGDTPTQRFTFGFADATTPSSANNVTSRVGLIGNNAGGFMFASVNCPDGGVAAETFGDVDANSFQPTDINAPGTNWFHVRIKMIPGTTIAGGSGPIIACYLNGTLVKQFTDTAVNFPRGSSGTSHNYERIEPTIYYDFTNPAGPAIMLADIRVWVEDDFSL